MSFWEGSAWQAAMELEKEQKKRDALHPKREQDRQVQEAVDKMATDLKEELEKPLSEDGEIKFVPLSEQVAVVPPLPSIKVMTTTGKCPTQATTGSAGWDLYAAEDAVVVPGSKPFPVSVGFKVSMPSDVVMLICSRSGLSIKGVIVANAPGVVDSDFRGEVKVILTSTPGLEKPFEIKTGDRIAQAIFQWVPAVPVERVYELDETARGEGGFGSTGK
jgi:dUTP pyrophosphatase